MRAALGLVAILATLAAPVLAEEVRAREPVSETGYWPGVEEVTAHFAAALPDECSQAFSGDLNADLEPKVWELEYNRLFDYQGAPPRRLTLYRFECAAGVYDAFQVYFAVTEYRGISVLSFAEPLVGEDVMLGVDTNPERYAEGFLATIPIANSTFDPSSGTIVSQTMQRNGADFFTRATYQVVGHQTVLKTFEIDVEYDNKTEAVLVFDHGITR